jgi:hypothetical protein
LIYVPFLWFFFHLYSAQYQSVATARIRNKRRRKKEEEQIQRVSDEIENCADYSSETSCTIISYQQHTSSSTIKQDTIYVHMAKRTVLLKYTSSICDVMIDICRMLCERNDTNNGRGRGGGGMVERKARMFRLKNIVASCLLFSHLFQPAYLCPSSVSHTLIFTSLALSRAREKMAYLDSIRFNSPSTVLFLFFLSLFYSNTDTVLMSYTYNLTIALFLN